MKFSVDPNFIPEKDMLDKRMLSNPFKNVNWRDCIRGFEGAFEIIQKCTLVNDVTPTL
ncbi:MAG: hypothetical protein PHY47_24710 [Lachnospiraceae bacterium]|nr:hypothetical protein [Lachnospiraceae bacterium]